MSLRDLIAADAKAVFLTSDMPDVEAIQYRTAAAAIEDAITCNALVERSAFTRAGSDQGRTVEAPLTIELAVADVASPAVGDLVKLAPWPGQDPVWREITRRVRSDDGIHRLEISR